EGKQRFSLNSRKHGHLSKVLIFADSEDQGEFEVLRTDLRATLSPQGALEEILVEEIVVCCWKLRRVLRWEQLEIRHRENLPLTPLLSAFMQGSKIVRLPVPGLSDDNETTTNGSPWQCKEMTLR